MWDNCSNAERISESYSCVFGLVVLKKYLCLKRPGVSFLVLYWLLSFCLVCFSPIFSQFWGHKYKGVSNLLMSSL